jgi:transcription antitermination factor NusG
MNEIKKWYAVYTHPKCEKKIAERLNRNKIHAYCPLNKVHNHWPDKKKIVNEPLFSSFVFVHISENDFDLVKETSGIVNFLYWINKPAVIRDEEIDAIKNFVTDCSDVKLERVSINLNEKVKVSNGAYIHQEGNLIEVQPKTVKVYLPSLGFRMVADFGNTKADLINKSKIEPWLAS